MAPERAHSRARQQHERRPAGHARDEPRLVIELEDGVHAKGVAKLVRATGEDIAQEDQLAGADQRGSRPDEAEQPDLARWPPNPLTPFLGRKGGSGAGG